MICVRCSNNTAVKAASAPDNSEAWEIYYCESCNFSWRSTEEDEVINPAKRDKWFQLSKEDLDNLLIAAPIPQLRKQAEV